MKHLKYLKFCLILYLLFFSFQLWALNSEPILRVAVQKNLAHITFSSVSNYPLKIYKTNTKNEIWAGNTVNIKPSDRGLKINHRQIQENSIIIENSENLFQAGPTKYRGKIKVINQNNKLLIVNSLPLDTYIAGLINSEISSSWPEETIKAQAIAARTYALNHMQNKQKARPNSLYDIGATTLDQVYFGAHREDLKSWSMVKATKGQVLKRNRKLFPTYYHSCCGGQTQQASNVWKNAKGPAPIIDKFCARSPKRNWKYTVSLKRFLNAVQTSRQNINKIVSITTIPFFDSPRVNTLLIETPDDVLEIKATKLRSKLGYSKFKSTWFEVKLENSQVIFNGHGYGHGVGMCQWGAKGMAEAGHNYRKILKFYYPDAQIKTIY